MKNKIIIILTIVTFLIQVPIFCLAEENKFPYFLQIGSNYDFTSVSGEIGISKQLNDYFEILEGVYVDKDPNKKTLLTKIKYFPFTGENSFFIENGYGLTIFREYNKIDSYKDTFAIPYYFGIGYDVSITKNFQIGLSIGYKDIFDFREINKREIKPEYPLFAKLSFITQIN
ncbi:MAG: hypothetical protein AABZ74_14055 [Cyanobacteriota bacterium]